MATKLNIAEMSEPQKAKAVSDLQRILFPEKGMHLQTLVALTAEGYEAPKKKAE